MTARPAPSTGIWCAVADSSTSSAAERSELLKLFSQESARYDRILLETCQRAELYGVGRIRCPASTSVRWLTDEDTVRHLLRVAAGLESAVIGENEVLGQVRQAFRKAVAAAPRHPVLQRLFETAVATGRRCRAGRRPNGAGLASLAARALLDRVRGTKGRLLVVGAGYMGAAIANVLATRCSELAIASRSREHAGAVASKLGVSALSLPDAAVCAPSARGVAVALSGPWSLDAATPLLPPTVDVSAPPALPATASVDYVGIDELLATCQRGDDAYVDRARWLVEAAVIAYLDSIQRRAEAV